MTGRVTSSIGLAAVALVAMPIGAQQTAAPPSLPQSPTAAKAGVSQSPAAVASQAGTQPRPALPDPANLRVTAYTVRPLRGGAYWLDGGRSNAAFIVGDKGVVAIDTGNTPEDAHQELTKIGEVTPKPVNQIIVTHADPDHVGGLPGFAAGTPVIAQENAKSEITASALAAANDPKLGRFVGIYSPIVSGYLPTSTVGMTETTTIDGVRMVLIHVAPAHTSGDLMVYLPKQKIVFAGDVLLTNTGRFPVIHYGGSSLGWIESMKTILALDADIYVPGHGTIVPKAKLQAMLQDVEQYRAQIKAMVEQKKSLAEVVQALPEPGASPMFLSFTQTVYKELTEGYPPASPPWTNLIVRR